MAYHRANLLQRIIEVQDITLKLKGKGLTQKRIYEDYIKDEYKIGYSTFNTWLGARAKADYKELLRTQAQNEKDKCSDKSKKNNQ